MLFKALFLIFDKCTDLTILKKLHTHTDNSSFVVARAGYMHEQCIIDARTKYVSVSKIKEGIF